MTGLEDQLTPVAIGVFVAAGGAVLSVVLNAMRFVRLVKGTPERRLIEVGERLVTVKDCTQAQMATAQRIDRLEREQTRIQNEMREKFSEINKQGEARAIALHERINSVLGAVSEVRGELRRMNHE